MGAIIKAPFRYCIGLSGGIACGKSSVAKLLAGHGLRVIDADLLARQVVLPGSPGLTEVVRVFGPGILLEDGNLDRERLGQLVFSDPELKAKLDQILHPRIWELLRRQIEAAEDDRVESVADIPLLFENEREHYFTETWAVVCSDSRQLERLCHRNGLSSSQAKLRIRSQLPNSVKAERATRVIENNGSPRDLEILVERSLRQWRDFKGDTRA